MNTDSAEKIIRKGRPSVQQAEQLKDLLLDEATRLFIEYGYSGTTIEAIAAGAGISKRTCYTRFRSKADIFEAVISRYVQKNIPVQPQAISINKSLKIKTSDKQLLESSRLEKPPLDNQSLETSLQIMSTHLLGWILEPNVLGLFRVAIAEVPRFPQLARTVAEYAITDATLAFEPLFRAHLSAQIPEERIKFIANQFMQAVVSEPFYWAVQGMECAGFNEFKRTRMVKAIELFLTGVRSLST